MKTNLKHSQISFLLDLMSCTMAKGSVPKDIFKYEKWNAVDSAEIYDELLEMYHSD